MLIESVNIHSTKYQTRRERLKSAPYLRLKKRKTLFFGKKIEIFEKKNFFQKKSHSAEKCKRGDPSGFINKHSVAKYQKTQRGDPLGTLKNFRKSRTVPKKNPKGGPFGHVRFCMFP